MNRAVGLALLKYSLLALALSVVALFVLEALIPEAHYRYRLTVEVDTPTGVKKASAIHAMAWGWSTNVPLRGYHSTIRGEAVFVDLGNGPDGKAKHLIALIPNDDVVSVVLRPKFGDISHAAYASITGVHVAKSEEPLTLVSFADINDPLTARIVQGRTTRFVYRDGGQDVVSDPIKEMERSFGAGYAFRGISVEMVPTGMWPFNEWDIAWPRALFGEPLTQGIEKRLPVMMAKLRERDKTLPTIKAGDPLQIRSHDLLIR